MSSGRTLSTLVSHNHEVRRSILAVLAISLAFCLVAWALVIAVAVALL
jgi:hypothetical protein